MMLSSLRSRLRSFRKPRAGTDRRGERGGALVEMTILAAPLLAIALGTVEIGVLWQQSIVLHEATRSGARVAASLVDDPAADREALRALVSHIGPAELDEVQYVVIYELNGAGEMPVGCDTGSQATCNHYPQAALLELDNDSVWECGGSAHDAAWCPTGRDAEFHSPIDVGVLVVTEQSSLSGFFPGSTEVKAETIMRLNPLTR